MLPVIVLGSLIAVLSCLYALPSLSESLLGPLIPLLLELSGFGYDGRSILHCKR